MSRTGAPPLRLLLRAAQCLFLLCGWQGETQAEFRLSPRSLPATREDGELPPVIALPPVEGSEQADAGPHISLAPQDDVANRPAISPKSAPPVQIDSPNSKPAGSTAVEDKRPLLPPNFAEAFAVRPMRTGDPEDRLAPLSGPSEPTPELIAVARQADAHIARGFMLAQRGATYTARAEFLRALRLSAAALDEQRQTVAHSRAVANGLRAFQEAEDFLPAAATTDQAVSIDAIIAGHRTPVLYDEPTAGLTPSAALQRYLTYAQDQLAAAAGDLQPAAAALYALGKLEMSAPTEIGSLPSARAAVYLQAALIVNPGHPLAANELGVLLARHGRLNEAKAALLHSVRSGPQATAWRNLAIVHHDLGETDLARRADWEARQVASAPHGGRGSSEAKPRQVATGPTVEWVDPATFAQATNFNGAVAAPVGANRPAIRAATAPAKAPAKTSTKSASHWLPWLSKTR